MQLPGLIDPHVHFREPGATYKEDWDSGTAAALAGGFTLVLAMPNTQPPVADEETLDLALRAARTKARCDYAQYLGAGLANVQTAVLLADRAAGLKLYLDQTYGPLRLDHMGVWQQHFAAWPKTRPLVAHAEGRSMAAVILMAVLYGRPLHLAHVSTREEILLIRAAKEKGIPITCEVTPHHLFLCDADLPHLGPGRGEVRPRLATAADRDALWQNLDVIDCFASDHAPHTPAEKDGPNPPPGFPGLESALPLYLTAMSEGRLTIEDIVARCVTNPRRIFNLGVQPETWIDIDPHYRGEIQAGHTYTRSAWTPFEGYPVRGRLVRTVLRGREAYRDGEILSIPGTGHNVRQTPFMREVGKPVRLTPQMEDR